MNYEEQLQSKDLKAILYSKRTNIYYLEKCRILVKDGRVTYLTQVKNKFFYYNIPIANTTVILLGTGTSITQAAVRYLSSAGVMLGFSGSNGTPLIAGTDIEWVSSKNEYRPTQFLQQWVSFWYDNEIRLLAAKKFQYLRLDFIDKVYSKDNLFRKCGFENDSIEVEKIIRIFRKSIASASDVNSLLLSEAKFTKSLYRIACIHNKIKDFSRDRSNNDRINQNLNYGNYLAYGLASLSLWALGIPPAFALMHGKTRRGALVFDVADLIKDAVVLPLAFSTYDDFIEDELFRSECIKKFTDYKVLDFMFDSVQLIAEEFSQIRK
jgi:CRISPR-associated protein Cas1